MRIYLFADREGVAGVFSRREGYSNAQECATVDLVTICRALVDRGVDDILLNSVHPVAYHVFPKQTRILHGLPRHDLFTEGLHSEFDAAFVGGLHAMAGGRDKGCWRHTLVSHPFGFAYASVEAAWLNDRPFHSLRPRAVREQTHVPEARTMTGRPPRIDSLSLYCAGSRRNHEPLHSTGCPRFSQSGPSCPGRRRRVDLVER